MDLKDRYRGALLGLAVGDALGTTLEFKPPGSFEPINDMIGGGPFGLEPGQWTDDTSMALCLAESLIEKQGFDPTDQMERYVRWWQKGHLSSTGTCFDIGITVRRALSDFQISGNPYSGSTHIQSAGNGSLMRLAPLPLAFRNDERRWKFAADSSATTHGTQACLDACGLYSELIIRALEGQPKEQILDSNDVPARLNIVTASAEIRYIAAGSYKEKMPPDIRGTGYVVDALEAALWAFNQSESFEEGALLAVNLGDDADTTGAIFGQLAGAYYGVVGIPCSWLSTLCQADLIKNCADELLALSETLSMGV